MLRGASFGVRVVCLLIIARKAGPELFGTIAVLFTAAEIAKVVADLGVDTEMLRQMATQQGSDLAKTVGAALSAKLVAATIAWSTFVVVALWPGFADSVLTLSIATLAVTPLALNFGANYFIATQRVATIAIPVTLLTGLALLAVAIATALYRGPTLILLIVAGYELLLGASLTLLAVRASGIQPVFSGRAAVDLVRASLPLGIAIAVGYSYGKLDVFILDRYCGKEAVGQYSMWARLLDPVLFVCGAVAITAYGHLSGAMRTGEVRRIRSIARRYSTLNLSITGSVAILVLASGNFLVRRWFPAYSESVWIGQVLAILLMIRSVNVTLTAVLQAAAMRALIMASSLVNFTIALVACLCLVRVLGVAGVLTGLLLMESINFAVQLTFARKLLVGTAERSAGWLG